MDSQTFLDSTLSQNILRDIGSVADDFLITQSFQPKHEGGNEFHRARIDSQNDWQNSTQTANEIASHPELITTDEDGAGEPGIVRESGLEELNSNALRRVAMIEKGHGRGKYAKYWVTWSDGSRILQSPIETALNWHSELQIYKRRRNAQRE